MEFKYFLRKMNNKYLGYGSGSSDGDGYGNEKEKSNNK
jgi:hypothetical protein